MCSRVTDDLGGLVNVVRGDPPAQYRSAVNTLLQPSAEVGAMSVVHICFVKK